MAYDDRTPLGRIANTLGIVPLSDIRSQNTKRIQSQIAAQNKKATAPVVPAPVVVQNAPVIKPERISTGTGTAIGKGGSSGVATAFSNDNQYSQAFGLSGLTPSSVSAIQGSLGIKQDGKFGKDTASALAQAQHGYEQGMPASSGTLPQSAYDSGYVDSYNYGGVDTAPVSSALTSAVGTTGSQSAPWYSTNAGGFSDEYLASLSPEDRIKAQGLSSNLANTIGTIGTGVSALSGIYDMYSQYQQNKMAKEAFNLQKSEYARQVQRSRDFAGNINKSGLGTMSMA